jgi:hypothetical protein
MDTGWGDLWHGLGIAQQATLLAGGAANAAYFVHRALIERGAARLAAGVLGVLFGGVALEASARFESAGGTVDIVRRAPLLAATLIAFAIVALPRGAR